VAVYPKRNAVLLSLDTDLSLYATILTYLLTYLITYLLTYLLHGPDSFFRT